MPKLTNITEIKQIILKHPEMIEALLGLLLLVAINFTLFRENMGFWDVHPHPYWIVVLPLAARYGFKAGLSVGVMAGITLVAVVKLSRPNLDMSAFMEAEYIGKPLLFVAVGVIIGEIREIQKKRYEELKLNFKNLLTKFENLSKHYDALNKAKHELDTRIISQEHTLSTLYEAAQALKTLKEEGIYPAVGALLKDFISVEACSIYMFADNKLQLAGSFGDQRNGPRPQKVDPGEGMMGRAISSGEVVSINSLISSDDFSAFADSKIIISAPMIDGGKQTIGVLNIEKLPFLKFNPQTVRMTSLIADWCSAAIENARTYKDTKDKNISDDITGAYTYNYFQQRLREEYQRARRYQIPLSAVTIEIVDFNTFSDGIKQDILTVLSLVLKNKLRGVNLIFHDRTPSKYILLLPHTPLGSAQVVKKKIISEINAFKFRPYEDGKGLLQIRAKVSKIPKDKKNANPVTARTNNLQKMGK